MYQLANPRLDGGGHHTGPLNGLRVLDVSIMAAGPWTAALLGMMGAEVIKVEPPDGDGTRWVAPTQNEMGTNFIAMNVNKKDITLDLKQPEGLEIALELAAGCDVLLQNFRVGVLDRLGLGYEALRKVNPRLVYCSISGFGETGPLSKAGCADYVMQAYSGFACNNGTSDGEFEAFRFTGFVDLTTASVAAEALLAALIERDASGEGQKVEVSMLEAAFEIQPSRVCDYLGAGIPSVPRGSESYGLAPDGAFRTLDIDVFVTVHNDRQWRGLCSALALDAFAGDPRFTTNRLRVGNREDLNDLLLPVFAARPALWWLRSLQKAGVPVSIAHSFETFRHHEQITSNKMIAQVKSEWGVTSVAGVPWHFSRTPCEVLAPPKPDQHTEEVLASLARVPAEAPKRSA